MSVATTRRIAAKVLKVGENRVKIKPDEVEKAAQALTADDVRQLIREKVVWAERVKGVPRIRAKLEHAKKKSGKRGGAGSRKGTKYSRISAKEQWMSRIRAQRGLLRELRGEKRLKEGTYRQAYLMIKGNAFRSKGAMLAHLKEVKWLKAEVARAEGAAKPAAPAAAAEEKK